MRLGIRSKLFLVSLVLIAVCLGVAGLWASTLFERYLLDRTRDDLSVRLALVVRAAEETEADAEDVGAWDALAGDLAERAGVRVTFVLPDGRVTGDSDVPAESLAAIDNHGGRPEIREALAAGRAGRSERWSATVHASMMYVAAPFLRDGRTAGVARVALPLTRVDEAVGRLHRFVLLAVGLALLLAVLMSGLAASWMSRAVRSLTAAARRMADGDLDVRTRTVGADEVAELGRVLDRLAAGLSTAVEDLRAERDLLGRILDGMQEGVLVLDRTGRIALVNPALRGMLDLDAAAIGRAPIEAVRNAGLQEALGAVSRSRRPASAEIEIGDRPPRRLLVHVVPLPDEAGGVLAVAVDVTDVRRLETIRRDFVANVSHELRTPVAAIRSAVETLEGPARNDPEASARFTDMIGRNAERLHRLIEDILDLSRIESRGFRFAGEPVEVEPIVRHVLSLFRERLEAKEMRVDVVVPPGIPAARGDRRAVEQILVNLIDNAVKYCPERGRIEVRAEVDDAGLRVSVADDGPGIEPRHLPRLFERFYRVDPGRSRELGGTGLGLSIVKHLVEGMGGSAGVESRVGEGSAFWFVLPATGRPETVGSAPPN